MVKKLYKYEFMSLLRWILPIDAFCLVISVILRASLEIAERFPESTVVTASSILIGLTFFLSLILMSIAAFWLVVVRFYKHLLSSEGYLTFTIPVSATTHLVCKLVCGSVVTLFSSGVTVIGVIIGFSGLIPSSAYKEIFSLFEPNSPFMSGDVIFHCVLFLIAITATMIISTVYGLILPYTAMCIGQLSRKNKIAMSVLWYFVLNTAVSVVSEIVSVINMLIMGDFFSNVVVTAGNVQAFFINIIDMYSIVFTLSSLTCLAFSIIGFIACKYLLTNKLNLE